ncbi:hypothetical protein IAQ61_011091 [Plenodomus lingam]|uniref:uncharacterized protein n=1 Tax=Leptosphaeria maculans TaxID=5022 RepID=UPI003323631D|nr:hypothetical protein IAQ61_011091 [Plenodomus lingam]
MLAVLIAGMQVRECGGWMVEVVKCVVYIYVEKVFADMDELIRKEFMRMVMHSGGKAIPLVEVPSDFGRLYGGDAGGDDLGRVDEGSPLE